MVAWLLDEQLGEIGELNDFGAEGSPGETQTFYATIRLDALTRARLIEHGKLNVKVGGDVFTHATIDLPIESVAGNADAIVQIQGRFG